MPNPSRRLKPATRKAIKTILDRLDYQRLAPIYCDYGGEAFWRDRRPACQRLGIRIAEAVVGRLEHGGRSLYVGAGVSDIPAMTAETLELGRQVAAFNLRGEEVKILNEACAEYSFALTHASGAAAKGTFDHIWMVSVLNDPEEFPELSALSYGRANPVSFDPDAYVRERGLVSELLQACLAKLTRPALVTTSVEEIPWVIDWCERRGLACVVGDEHFPTAIVGDPICFIHIG